MASITQVLSIGLATLMVFTLDACSRVRIKSTFSEGWYWISGIQPIPNDPTVDPTAPVAIEFAKDLDPQTVTEDTFRLRAGDVYVPAYVTYLFEERIAVLEPKQALSTATTYEASLSTEVRDSTGDGFPEAIAWTFRTHTALTVRADTEAGEPAILTMYDKNGRLLGQRQVRIVARTR